jgi:predicted transcriptional regulator
MAGRRAERVGIASHEKLRARAIAIASGARGREQDEPRVWFTSLELFRRVVSPANLDLLRTIERRRPGSLEELEAMTGRNQAALRRSLGTLSRHGLIRLHEDEGGLVRPEVLVRRLHLDLSLVG